LPNRRCPSRIRCFRSSPEASPTGKLWQTENHTCSGCRPNAARRGIGGRLFTTETKSTTAPLTFERTDRRVRLGLAVGLLRTTLEIGRDDHEVFHTLSSRPESERVAPNPYPKDH
jgi:hypothetical protein